MALRASSSDWPSSSPQQGRGEQARLHYWRERGPSGEAVIKELRRAGHEVTGLSRIEASDAKLRALGATPHRGLLDQPASDQSAAGAEWKREVGAQSSRLR